MRTLFRGGYVHTAADPHATAIAFEDDVIAWTGDDDAADHFLDNADRIVELEGRLVVPAFVSARPGPGIPEKGVGLVIDQLADTSVRVVEPLAEQAPLATLMKEGIALAFASHDPWSAIRAAAWHPDESERITVRAAFNAHTRGGWRAGGRGEGGMIAPGAPAYVAVFDVPGDLVVQTPDERVAAWSTDTRAGVPLLPAILEDGELPTCWLTIAAGKTVYRA